MVLKYGLSVVMAQIYRLRMKYFKDAFNIMTFVSNVLLMISMFLRGANLARLYDFDLGKVGLC